MTHRYEFPAEYSLAERSPAEPASASPAVLMLNQKPSVRQHFSANGNYSLGLLSHFAAQRNSVPRLFYVLRRHRTLQ
jgi:hypothetical protein